MSFFLNPFNQDFSGHWILGDRSYNPEFRCPRNAGRGDEIVMVWNQPTFSLSSPSYNLSGNDSDGNAKNVLKIVFSMNDFKNWATVSVTISAASLATTQISEIVTSLTANSIFNDFFTVTTSNLFSNGIQRIAISQKLPITKMKFYVQNGQAESVLGFNKRAGVAELPAYFARHTMANRFTYTDSQNALIQLNPGSSNIDASAIDNAVDAYGNTMGFSHSTVHTDWQLLKGKSGLFQFQKNTIDASNRITASIIYPAGAAAGDLATKTTYTYTSTNTNPDQVTSYPYVLQSADLVTPT